VSCGASQARFDLRHWSHECAWRRIIVVIKVDFVGCSGWRTAGLGDGLAENKAHATTADEIRESNQRPSRRSSVDEKNGGEI
jgi:hypothetical protein